MNTKHLDKSDQAKYFTDYRKKYVGEDRIPALLRKSKKYLSGKVLDVGAGNGRIIEAIPGAVGIDLSPRHPDVIQGEITAMPFADSAFGTVFCSEVLEHLEDDILHGGLKEIRRVMETGGKLIITVPFDENLEAGMVYCPDCEKWFHRAFHVRSFDQQSMTDVLAQAGFRVVDMKVLPLGTLGRHPFLELIWKPLYAMKILKTTMNLFVVATK